MYKDNERAEKKAQKKFDRTLKRYSKIVEKKDKGKKYSENRLTRITDKFGDRALKLTAIQYPGWDAAYKSTKEKEPVEKKSKRTKAKADKPKGEKERELTPDELYERKSMRGLKRLFKKEETGKAEREEKPERNWTTYKEARELTSDELYLDKKTPRQIARAYFKEGRTEAKAAAAAARAYRKGKMS